MGMYIVGDRSSFFRGILQLMDPLLMTLNEIYINFRAYCVIWLSKLESGKDGIASILQMQNR